MPKNFHKAIHASLTNATLQAALNANAERRFKAREQALVSLQGNLQEIRQRAHKARADTIAHLDKYLEEFSNHAQSNGFIIHKATNSDQALEIIRQIAHQHHARLIAKSKTMLGEEIHLNQAMENNGLKVVETDLGEYIVQLRDEPPAHIVTPAVHLNRVQVGRTFEEKLGIPFTDDIPTLTLVARRVLRKVFLEADVGVSGVNFGIVENGGICLLTNEGNGRMVTTLPKVHIALMGIERLVPTLDDLALMLTLLPRFATGQKMTVYASLILGPRREGEADGCPERHIVLVDNGRQALRGSPLSEALYCIRCGACLNACPVFREIGGHAYVSRNGQVSPYPGPIGSVLSPGLFGLPNFGHLARASSLCGACKEACPVDIDLPRLLLQVRSAESGEMNYLPQTAKPKDSHIPPSQKLALQIFSWVARSPWRFRGAQIVAAILGRLWSPFSPWMRLPALTGWGLSRDLPRPAFHPHRNLSPIPQPSADIQPQKKPLKGEAPASRVLPLPPKLLIEQFGDELTSLGGFFFRCGEDKLGVQIQQLLDAKKINALQAWDVANLPSELFKYLTSAGIRIYQEPGAPVQAGLTGAFAAIADSGTLILNGGIGRPYSTSLLPEMHIAILHAQDIYNNLATALRDIWGRRSEEIKNSSSLILISGPSRTADIEMTLTIGVHGPREIYVFCLE